MRLLFVGSSSRASRKLPRSPRLAHKAPVMQANIASMANMLKVPNENIEYFNFLCDDTFFSKLETKTPDFKSLSHDTLISLLMNSSAYLINCQFVSFISQCFELRTKLISMNE